MIALGAALAIVAIVQAQPPTMTPRAGTVPVLPYCTTTPAPTPRTFAGQPTEEPTPTPMPSATPTTAPTQTPIVVEVTREVTRVVIVTATPQPVRPALLPLTLTRRPRR